MKENRRAVLRAEIRSLAVHLRWVMSLPENVEQLFVTHFCRIERHLQNFRMAGFVRANGFVIRFRRFPAPVPYGGINHPRHALKRCLHAPETPRSESRYLCHSYHPLVQTRVTSRAQHLDARAVDCDSPATLGRFSPRRRRPRAGL